MSIQSALKPRHSPPSRAGPSDMGEWQRNDDGAGWHGGGWGRDSSSARGSHDDGGQWAITPWGQQPPPPPPIDPVSETYRTAFQYGFTAGLQARHGNLDDRGWKKKTKWVKYEEADVSQRPIFTCQLGQKPDSIAVYPKVIQEKLRAAHAKVHDEGAQEVLYEMSDWMTTKIRLFNKDEYEKRWAVRLGKLVVEANGDVVGAQWNASFNGEPPDSWDDSATYRPTYMQD